MLGLLRGVVGGLRSVRRTLEGHMCTGRCSHAHPIPSIHLCPAPFPTPGPCGARWRGASAPRSMRRATPSSRSTRPARRPSTRPPSCRAATRWAWCHRWGPPEACSREPAMKGNVGVGLHHAARPRAGHGVTGGVPLRPALVCESAMKGNVGVGLHHAARPRAGHGVTGGVPLRPALVCESAVNGNVGVGPHHTKS